MSATELLTNIANVANAASPFLALTSGIKAAGQAKTAGIYQAGLYEIQAIDTMSLAKIRATESEKVATLQAGRRLLQAQIQARNYMIQGNRVLDNMRATNAAIRARAAANGVDIGSGSAMQLQRQVVRDSMFDLGLLDYNALTAKVFGYEDASQIYLQGIRQGLYDVKTAEIQASELRTAADFSRKAGQAIASNQMLQTGANFLTNIDTAFSPLANFFDDAFRNPNNQRNRSQNGAISGDK